jgi:tRNA (cytidine/uridine-2'-O-)-methyltransferase
MLKGSGILSPVSDKEKFHNESYSAPFSVVLIEPEIPPNTGNVVRTCAATGCDLHLVEPFGFIFGDRLTQRAGLDYWDQVRLKIHRDLDSFLEYLGDGRAWLFSARADKPFHEADFREGDFLLFGRETRGLPDNLVDLRRSGLLKLPMAPWARSLNLANSVGIALYEALRQTDYQFPSMPPGTKPG